MATSGSKTILVDSVPLFSAKTYLKFSWERTAYSIDKNTSTITWALSFYGVDGGYNDGGSHPYTIIVDGNKYTGTVNTILAKNETKILVSNTTVINNDANGAKTFSYSFSQELYVAAGLNSSEIATRSGSGTGVLDAIPVKPYIAGVRDFTDEDTPYIAFENPMGNSVTSIQAGISFDNGVTMNIPYRDVSRAGTNIVGNQIYYFNFTDNEKATLWALLDGGVTSLSVRFYLWTEYKEETFLEYKTATLTFVNYKPTLSPVVTATDEGRTKELTGDTEGNTLIRYYSTVQFSSGAEARKGANIENEYVRCGGAIVAGNMPEGTIEAVDSGSFEFSVTDTRGFTTLQTLEKTLVPYIKLTCSIESAVLDNNGKLTFSLTGKYFNGSFGAKNNTMEVEYSVEDESGNPVFNTNGSGWVVLGTVTPTVDPEGTYTYRYTISGLDYTRRYTLYVNVIDEISPQQSLFTVLGNIAVFDWGKDDFNFNVPVEICNRFKVTKEGQIHGATTDGSFIQVMDPCNGNNNLVIGYGNYAAETQTPTGEKAGTNLYGNTVNLMHKNGITINWTPLADFVVEQGGYNTWFYRKWNSGRVELYGYQNVSSVACNTALGNMYRTAVITAPAFPFLVYSAKMVSSYESDGYGAFIWHTTLTTNDKPASYYLVRPTSSAAITGRVHFFIQGSWK